MGFKAIVCMWWYVSTRGCRKSVICHFPACDAEHSFRLKKLLACSVDHDLTGTCWWDDTQICTVQNDWVHENKSLSQRHVFVFRPKKWYAESTCVSRITNIITLCTRNTYTADSFTLNWSATAAQLKTITSSHHIHEMRTPIPPKIDMLSLQMYLGSQHHHTVLQRRSRQIPLHCVIKILRIVVAVYIYKCVFVQMYLNT